MSTTTGEYGNNSSRLGRVKNRFVSLITCRVVPYFDAAKVTSQCRPYGVSRRSAAARPTVSGLSGDSG
ncbi:hypothetical protein [Nonomuraea roseoviolacea]|uniref:hypothetical protein n=1 Tax=Nonomuraea roseoviolacea TaxID=103837 RepID=UPI0031E99F95